MKRHLIGVLVDSLKELEYILLYQMWCLRQGLEVGTYNMRRLLGLVYKGFLYSFVQLLSIVLNII